MTDKRQKEVATLLAGDIGATKITLALFSNEGGPRSSQGEATYSVDDYPRLSDLLDEYLTKQAVEVDTACFGVAGPVIAGRAEMTNHDWVVDGPELETRFGFQRAWLLNDLEATSMAVPLLHTEELLPLKIGQAEETGNIAVIAPGTGLGQGYLTWDGQAYQAHPSEGGHASFAPIDAVQRDLLAYMSEQQSSVTVEDVCAGVGMPNIYRFLRDSGRAEEGPALRSQIDSAEDPTPIIFEVALRDGPEAEICRMAASIFVSILGSEAGNLALKIGATGGLYLGGGIPPKIRSLLEADTFVNAFLNKHLYRDYMEKIPILLILNPATALLGAAHYGLRQLDELNHEE